jgi:hypothetical protein
MTRTCRILQVGKATVSRWYRQAGIVINPERNGVALRGRGLQVQLASALMCVERRRAKRLKQLVTAMERVARRERIIPSPTAGMANAQAFAWRYEHDPIFKLKHLLRERTRKALKRSKRKASCLSYLGCTAVELKQHIEKQFEPWMNWQNLGVGEGKWNLDHIKPFAAFNTLNEDELARCSHHTNLRPLGSLENIRKGGRVSLSELK